MNKVIYQIFCFILLMLTSTVYAATNPMLWSATPASGLPAQTQDGNTYEVSYTFTNNLPFAMPLNIGAEYTGGSFMVTNTCNGNLLVPNGSCTAHITFQPIYEGTSSIRLIMEYGYNRVPVTRLTSVSTKSNSVPTERVNGHITVPLPPITYIGTTYPITFTFINDGNTSVTPTAVNITGALGGPITNTCSVPPNQPLGLQNPTCSVSGTFTPAATGQTSVGVTYVYNGGSRSVPLVTTTDVQNNSGACHHVNGIAALPLPATTFQYADNVVKYVFTNHCNASTETLGTVNLTAVNGTTPVNSWLTKGTDTCTGATLAANGSVGDSCSVYVSVVPTSTSSNLAVTGSVSYDGNSKSASATTSEIVNAVPNQASTHTVTFVNQCDKNVWYEFQNGDGSGSGITKKSPDPTPSGQNTMLDYQLNLQITGAAPATKTLSVNEYLNGAIYGRTGCDVNTGQCETANCPVIPGTGTCQAAVGANNPTTIFETNMSSSYLSDGVYDVSIINGFNIPGEVKSLAPLTIPSNPADSFGCGEAAGALIQPTGSALGACPWSFTPPSGVIGGITEEEANYLWVSGGADDACVSGAACGVAGEICGTAFNVPTPEGQTPINRRCGTFLGYWTIATLSGYTAGGQWGSNNLYTYYNLDASLPTGPDGSYGTVNSVAATYKDMFQCNPTSTGSLYSGYTHTTNVCGCYNWNQPNNIAYTAQNYNCAVSSGQNSDWITHVFPRISWLKKACPTAYSFQFDDPSVSFTCNVANQLTAYQITYCPGGKTGAPGT